MAKWSNMEVATATEMWFGGADMDLIVTALSNKFTKAAIVAKMHNMQIPRSKEMVAERYRKLPIMQAHKDQCKYPLWEATEKTGNVCGLKVVSDKSSWCKTHQSMVYKSDTPKVGAIAG